MSKWDRIQELNNFKDRVIRKLVYWNAVKLFSLFLSEGLILYCLVLLLGPYTVIYNHVWLIGILTCFVVIGFFYLNVLKIDGIITAHGRIKWDYGIDKYFYLLVNTMISCLGIAISYSGIECLVTAVLTVVIFAEVMNVLISTIFATSAIFTIMMVLLYTVINERRNEDWWCAEVNKLFREKTVDASLKEVVDDIKDADGREEPLLSEDSKLGDIFKGQYDR